MEVKPGYKQTEVGVIPEEWQVKQLGALVSYTNGKAHEQSITDYGRYVVVNSKFISTEGEIRKYSDHCYCPTSVGDVLMVMSDVPNGRAIAKCFWVDKNHTYTVNQRICALHPRQIDGKLLFYKLDKNLFYLAFDDGVKQTNLRKDDVLSCPLGIPKSDDEQRAIAGVLGDVDALLGALEKFIAKKRDLKQGAMQQLLTGKTRLCGFSGEWEAKRLGEIGTFTKGKGIKKDEVVADGLPCIRYGEIYTHYNDYIRSFRSFISLKVARESQRLKKGDLLFAGSGETAEEIGKCVVFLGDEEAYAGGDIVILSPAGQNSMYLGYLMNHTSVIEQKAQMGQGDAVVHISASNLGQLNFRLPLFDEQTAIATVLSDMDAEIAALEQRLAKTRALKQGMMQELLTGKTRLI
jgi:type I restriction enzyme S subunit